MKDIKITVLCENTVVGKVGGNGEHGFAVWIETDNTNILFDTGNGSTLVNNSLTFGIDLKEANLIALSHGHYDHTGGLVPFLNIKGEIPIYAHPDIMDKKISIRKISGKETRRYIGIPYELELLKSLGAKFIFNKDFIEIEEKIFLTGEVKRRTTFEKDDPQLFITKDGKDIHDPMLDDQSLIIDTKKGLIVILGCAHAGIINILHHAIEKTGKDHILLVMGGTHLGFLEKEQLEKSIEALHQFDIEKIGGSHCTGLTGLAHLMHAFGERFFFASVGTVVKT